MVGQNSKLKFAGGEVGDMGDGLDGMGDGMALMVWALMVCVMV